MMGTVEVRLQWTWDKGLGSADEVGDLSGSVDGFLGRLEVGLFGVFGWIAAVECLERDKGGIFTHFRGSDD